MKWIWFILLAVIIISCEVSETSFEYPDCISKPNDIVESSGCGNIFVYQYLDSLRILTVSINGNELNLTKKCQTIDLNGSNPHSSVVLEIAGNDLDSVYFNYCNDVVYMNMGVSKKFKATSGKLYFSVSEDNPIKDPVWKSSYFVTIRIIDLHLYNQEDDDEIVIDEIVFWDARVGWMPG